MQQAEKSLIGNWEVYEIISESGEYIIEKGSVKTIGEIRRNEQTGKIGSFTFSDNKVRYNFKSDGEMYLGKSPWKLDLTQVNQGFFKVNKWILTVGDNYIFDVQFGNSTKNAEKNARMIQLNSLPKTNAKGVAYFMKLKKN